MVARYCKMFKPQTQLYLIVVGITMLPLILSAQTTSDPVLSPLCFLVAGGVIATVLWYLIRSRRFSRENLKLEAKVALRTSQLQQDKRTIEKQAESLKALDQVRSRFVANVAHELRTPLSLIMAPTSQLLQSDKLGEEEKGKLELIEKNTERILRLVNEMLDLSKLEAGKMELREQAIPVAIFIRDLLLPFDTMARQKGIAFKADCQLGEDHYVIVDQHKLEQILGNLLSNALKFTGDRGMIELTATATKGHLILKVTDTGKGIHPDDLPFIFDRFYQSSQLTGDRQTGTGIGLSLSRELAELMGGDLVVNSQYGERTTFTLTLPNRRTDHPSVSLTQSRKGKDEQADQSSDFEGLPSENLNGEDRQRILLVEDQNDMRAYLKGLLGTYYSVLTANDGAEALRMLEENQMGNIDLIITDLMMPGMDGLTFVQALKQKQEWCLVPTIMLTAKAGEKDRLRALQMGIDDLIAKPFPVEELLIRVRNHLQNNRRRRQAGATPGDHLELHNGKTADKEAMGWLEQLHFTVEQRMGAFDFNIEQLSQEMAMSRRQLSRKVKELTGLTANQYVQEVRLQAAKNWLEQGTKSSVKSIAYELGLKDAKYFSKLYTKRFGKKPSELL